ncbi:neuropilin-1a-like [Denticeps clupeoides]|uniref:Neuropilin n=1 Tax=Denticeps clupeoides TaxID=299321 RepID=A0AAY4AJT0_9TELE|nr:neuropilin-1a-like [Denticeps clupeoides]
MLRGLVLLFAAHLPLVAPLAATERDCGGRVVFSAPGYLTSPVYPNNYPPTQHCEWLIEAADEAQRILINFNPHFDLEDRECKYDFVEVYNGGDDRAPLVGKFCGKIAPAPVISLTNQLFIRFVSDYETSGAGFSIRYEIHKQANTECSTNLTETSGVIHTPGFPEKYPNNLECTYMIFAPQFSEIVLQFLHFSLEPDTTPPPGAVCRYDWVEIWDGYPTVGPHIGRFCGDSNPGRVVSHTGILSITVNTDNAIGKEGFEANYTILPRPLPPDNSSNQDSCMDPLGMESGEITSDQITASSQYNPSWSPERSRLNYIDNGWTPSEDTSREWIQVDLGFLRYVSAIGTQGAISKETKKSYYVKSYKVYISTNKEDWMPVKEESKHKVFEGNQNPLDEVRSRFPKPTLTRYIRIRPMTWENGICMRFEIYGCKINDPPCSGMLGMVSGHIPDSHISVWPRSERGWLPENVRLVTGRSGWTLPPPAPSQQQKEQWLQLDLGVERLVSALVLQGGRLRDKNVFVRRFRVAYSNNGNDWNYVLEDDGLRPKIFMGNQNHDTPEVRPLGQLLTRFLKIYPERGSPDGMGLRLEVLGCSPQEPTTLPPPTTTIATTFSATTTSIPVTTPINTMVTTVTDECDDESNNCNSGNGDYEPTVGTMVVQAMPEIDHLPEYVWFFCDFGWAEKPSYCAWNTETGDGADWLIHTTVMPINPKAPNQENAGGPGNFVYAAVSSESHRVEEGDTEGRIARLASPPVTEPDSGLCISFRYRLSGDHAGLLRVKQRREEEQGNEEETEKETRRVEEVLWMASRDQGHRWREGRVLMPPSNFSYQVVFEGVIDRHGSGHLALDDICILDGISAAECKDPKVEEISTSPPVLIYPLETDYPVGRVNNELGGSGSMLRTLDPILITIIAMSALGVLLGAVCGVVLYCACSNGSMADRNLSALENYNFELVDGVKLKKEKLNTQNSYSEA